MWVVVPFDTVFVLSPLIVLLYPCRTSIQMIRVAWKFVETWFFRNDVLRAVVIVVDSDSGFEPVKFFR